MGDVWARDGDGSRTEHGNSPETASVRLSLQRKVDNTSKDREDIGDDVSHFDLIGVPYPHQPYLKYLAQIASFCQISAQMERLICSSTQRRSEAIWRTPDGDMEIDYSMRPVRALIHLFRSIHPLSTKSRVPSRLPKLDHIGAPRCHRCVGAKRSNHAALAVPNAHGVDV